MRKSQELAAWRTQAQVAEAAVASWRTRCDQALAEVARLNALILDRADRDAARLVDLLHAPRDQYQAPAAQDDEPSSGYWSEDGMVWLSNEDEEI